MATNIKFSGRLTCLECGATCPPGSVVELCQRCQEEEAAPKTKGCGSCGRQVASDMKFCQPCADKLSFDAIPSSAHLEGCGVPPRTANAVEESGKVEEFASESLFIFGPVGCGKTFKAAEILLSAISQCPGLAKDCRFISCPQLLHDIRKTYSGPTKSTSTDLVEYYQRIDLLVLDDIGVEKITDWVASTLYLILSHRFEYNKTTIITSNLNLLDLTNRLGDNRLTSRIFGWCRLVEMTGKDRRR